MDSGFYYSFSCRSGESVGFIKNVFLENTKLFIKEGDEI